MSSILINNKKTLREVPGAASASFAVRRERRRLRQMPD